MATQEQIHAEMVAAMKARDETRLSVLRGLLTMFMQELTATKRTPQDELSDDEVTIVIRRALKQRKDSAEQFRAGGRTDLAEKEELEAGVLTAYLPAQLTRAQIEDVVRTKISALGTINKTDAGKLTGAVMSECKNKADGALVREVVNHILGL